MLNGKRSYIIPPPELRSSSPLSQGDIETENGTAAGSESRSKVCFDYAERQGGKDREAGLKRKTKSLTVRRFA